VLFNNRLLGGVRVRQVRAAPNEECFIPPALRSISSVCYSPEYSSDNADTSPFGPPDNPEKYQYMSAEETGSARIDGSVYTSIDGGGYVVDFPLGSAFTEGIQQLVNDSWWDMSTRAIIVTMNFLSIDLGTRVAVLYLIVENPGTGAFIPSFFLKNFRLYLYESPLDWFRFSFEIVFILLLTQSIYVEIEEMKAHYAAKKLKKYFFDGWNIIELINIVLFLVTIALYLKFLVDPARSKDLTTTTYFPEMEQLAAIAFSFFTVSYFSIMLLTFRTFKYLRLNQRLYMIWKSLRHAGADLFGYTFIFCIVCFGFIFTSWVSFGTDLIYFSTFEAAFGTCWNFLIGNPPDPTGMFQYDKVLGPVFFTLFSVFVYFILANVFIAIVSKSYGDVSQTSENLEFKETLENKIMNLVSSTRHAVRALINRGGSSNRPRTIIQILDELAHPEILDSPILSLDDACRAIGPDAKEDEARELIRWHTWLEAKKRKKLKARSRSFRSIYSCSNSSAEGSEDDLIGEELGTIGTRQFPAYAELRDIQASIAHLQRDMHHLIRTISRHKGKTGDDLLRDSLV